MGQVGDVDAALKPASRTIEAEYNWPFQGHAMMGPGCAVADVRPDGATVWSGTQHPHQLQSLPLPQYRSQPQHHWLRKMMPRPRSRSLHFLLTQWSPHSRRARAERW